MYDFVEVYVLSHILQPLWGSSEVFLSWGILECWDPFGDTGLGAIPRAPFDRQLGCIHCELDSFGLHPCFTAVEALSQFLLTGQWHDSGRQYMYRTGLPTAYRVRETVLWEFFGSVFCVHQSHFTEETLPKFLQNLELLWFIWQLDIGSEVSLQGKLCRFFPRTVNWCEA